MRGTFVWPPVVKHLATISRPPIRVSTAGPIEGTNVLSAAPGILRAATAVLMAVALTVLRALASGLRKALIACCKMGPAPGMRSPIALAADEMRALAILMTPLHGSPPVEHSPAPSTIPRMLRIALVIGLDKLVPPPARLIICKRPLSVPAAVPIAPAPPFWTSITASLSASKTGVEMYVPKMGIMSRLFLTISINAARAPSKRLLMSAHLSISIPSWHLIAALAASRSAVTGANAVFNNGLVLMVPTRTSIAPIASPTSAPLPDSRAVSIVSVAFWSWVMMGPIIVLTPGIPLRRSKAVVLMSLYS
ncbi:hypothetical protein BKA57DRAFT_472306 [Linnemannia elongata]|nr:hypothetical protein BKA57DRAFT_472306 [Linnemannia elongata]